MSIKDGMLRIAKRISFLLIEPHHSIVGVRKRQQARLLSSLLLLAMPIFGYINFTIELSLHSPYTLLVAIIAVFLLYLGTRTRYYGIVSAFTLASFTVVPILIFLLGTDWHIADLPRLMIWVFVALVGGLLLAKPEVVLAQGIVIISTMTYLVMGVFGIPFSEYNLHLGNAIIIVALTLVASLMLESYIEQLDYQTTDSNQKAKELEVYTQLLRHDLRNDLQAILSSIELAEMFLDVNIDKVKENLSQSLNLGQRMVNLLHVFSMPLEQPGTDLVKNIEEIALEAQKTHSNLKIEISSANEVRTRTFTASRLLPMVWTNIFRNAAQYCGNPSIVKVDISLDEDNFLVSISDNGPGIPDQHRQWLFKRGSISNSSTSGVGLYLSRIVLESHDGTIELSNAESGGTSFLIRMPSSAKQT